MTLLANKKAGLSSTDLIFEVGSNPDDGRGRRAPEPVKYAQLPWCGDATAWMVRLMLGGDAFVTTGTGWKLVVLCAAAAA